MTILLPETFSSGAGPLGPPVGVVVGLGVGDVTEPVQVTPLSATDAGCGLAPFHAPLNPMDADPPVSSVPFQSRLVADTWVPDCAQVALQPLVTFWSEFGKSNVAVHPRTGEPRLVMARSAVNPPGHSLCTLYATEQPVAAADAGRVAMARPPRISAPAAPVAIKV